MTAPLARQGQHPVCLLPVTLGVVALAGALWTAVVAGLATHEVSPLWITALLLCGFVVADLSEVHVEVRRHTVSLSLSEVPLVLGLFLVDPLSLLAARLLGTVVMEFWRRSAPDKASFNLALFSAEVATAVLLFAAVGGGADEGPRAWAAAYVATLGAALLTGALVCLAIVRMQGPLARTDVVLMLAPLVVGSQLSTTFVLVALVTVSAQEQAVVLLGVLLLLCIGGYRGYSTLLRRHRSLAQMRDFTADMSAGGTADELASQALRHARGLLSATDGVLALDGSGRRPPSTLAQRGEVEQSLPEPPADAVTRQVRASGTGIVVPRGSRDPAISHWLQEQGVRDAVVVPLLSKQGVVGTLQVGQRLGETGTFGDADRQLLQMVAVHLEIALRSGDLLEELRYEATHDSLTGLPNRTLFQERVTATVAGSSGGAFAVLLLDLDGFKDVNDTLGHRAGDRLLQDVARRLEQALPSAVTVARLGGDEFALLVQVGEDPAEVESVAAAVQHALRQPVVLDAVEIEVRASIGVARFPEHGTDGALLLQRADIAMYAAKEARLPVLVYEAEIDRSSPRRLALISELRTAIESGQLICHYQPKVGLDGRTVLGVEALVRWSHPRMGLVAPDDFVPIAERTGLIVPMTSFVLETALRDCARWRAEGRDLGVAVNVSPRGLLAPHFAAEVAALLGQAEVPPSALTLEITESSIMSDPVKALEVLAELHAVGVQLSIDDFGTGYSSLAYLQRLPVHEVKIDKSFVLDLATDDSNVAIVRAIVDLAHNLGMRVVAEGVEDQRSLVILRQLGCHAVQGYLVSRPLPAAVLESWLLQPDGPGPDGAASALVSPRLIALP